MSDPRTPARREARTSEAARRSAASPSVHGDTATLLTLDPADIASEDVSTLQARGAAYVRGYVEVEHKPTILLQNIAVVLIALRRQFTTDDGVADMRGQTHPYRQAAAELYRAANIPPDSQARVQTAVRWHVGNILRTELDAEELTSYELLTASPLERLQDDRAARAAIVSASRAESAAVTSAAGGVTVKATADSLRMAGAALNILRQLSADVIDNAMTEGQRAKLDELLAEHQTVVAQLRRHTRKRRSQP